MNSNPSFEFTSVYAQCRDGRYLKVTQTFFYQVKFCVDSRLALRGLVMNLFFIQTENRQWKRAPDQVSD